jgi:hypothetical protein
MSIAAFHLSQTDRGGQTGYRQRARDHQKEAVKIINGTLAEKVTDISPWEKFTILAAALSLITTHVWGADRTDCDTFLDLAKRLARETGGEVFWKSSVLSNMLFQILRCYDLVAATARLQSKPADQGEEGSERTSHDSTPIVLEDAAERDDESVIADHDKGGGGDAVLDSGESSSSSSPPPRVPYILNSSFGIASQTMSLLHQAVQLGSSYAAHPQSSTWPESLLNATDKVAKGLQSIEQDKSSFAADRCLSSLLPFFDGESAPLGSTTTTVTNDDLQQRGGAQEHLPKAVREEIMENYQWAFHTAVVLYFHRAVPAPYFSALLDRDGGTSSPRRRQMGSLPLVEENCQALVERLMDHLENIDCLTEGTKIRPAMALWPAFIAAVEAIDVELRHRALAWFSKAMKKGIGNIPRAKEVVMATWRETCRRLDGEPAPERGLSPVDWRLVMKDSGHIIMLA